MKGRELNKFGTCHMSFGPMNITESKLKMKNYPNFTYIWAILLNQWTQRATLPKNREPNSPWLENELKFLHLLYDVNNFFPSHRSLGNLNTYPSEQLVSYVIPRERSVVIVQYSGGYGVHMPAGGTNNWSTLLGRIDPWDLMVPSTFTPHSEYWNRHEDSECHGWVGGFSISVRKEYYASTLEKLAANSLGIPKTSCTQSDLEKWNESPPERICPGYSARRSRFVFSYIWDLYARELNKHLFRPLGAIDPPGLGWLAYTRDMEIEATSMFKDFVHQFYGNIMPCSQWKKCTAPRRQNEIWRQHIAPPRQEPMQELLEVILQ